MIKVTYKERSFINDAKTKCVDTEQVYVADKIQYSINGRLAYLYRGGYCQRCINSGDIIKIEELCHHADNFYTSKV